jgi:hypothetical protein
MSPPYRGREPRRLRCGGMLVRAQHAAAVAAGAALLIAPGVPQAQAAVADVTHAPMIGAQRPRLKPSDIPPKGMLSERVERRRMA